MIYMMDLSFTDVLLIESELVKLILDYIHERNTMCLCATSHTFHKILSTYCKDKTISILHRTRLRYIRAISRGMKNGTIRDLNTSTNPIYTSHKFWVAPVYVPWKSKHDVPGISPAISASAPIIVHVPIPAPAQAPIIVYIPPIQRRQRIRYTPGVNDALFIRNPTTGRYVLRNGPIGRRILRTLDDNA